MERRDKKATQSPTAGQKPTRMLTFLSICWNLELTSRRLVSKIIERENSQEPSNPRGHRILHMHELSRLLPTINPKEQILFFCRLCTYPRTRLLHLPNPFIYSQCDSFKTTYTFLPTICVFKKKPINSRMVGTAPFSPAAGSLDFMPQDRLLFLASNVVQ